MIFGPQNGSEIVKKRIKIYVENKHIFRIDFLLNFLRFGFQKWNQNPCFFEPFLKTSILRKSCSRRGESSIFKVRSLKKSTQHRCANAFEKNIEKMSLKHRFSRLLWPPKTSKIAPKSDAKRSLFRDAMGTARTSAEIMKNLLQPNAKRWAARQPHAAGKAATI